MVSDHMRASDLDRDAVVATLRDAYTAGRLTLEEFDERMAAAYLSKTWGELRKLTDDLPVQPVLGADLPEGALPAPQHSQAQPGKPQHSQPAKPPAQYRRGRALMPIVAIWVLLVLGSRAPAIVVPVVVLLILFVFMSTARRR
jgi:hypothetical protein